MAGVRTLTSNWARFAFVVLALFWVAAGWFVMLQGGFATAPKRSTHITFVGGAGGALMACIFLLLAAVAAAVVLQSLRAPRAAYVVLALLVFGPACIHALSA
jgi:hypothetical protein